MITKTNRTVRAAIVATLAFVHLFTQLPHTAMAQEGNPPLYLPTISGGIKESLPEEPENPEEPEEPGNPEEEFTGFDQIPDEQLESALLVEASAQLPEPTPDPAAPEEFLQRAARDLDADGVPNNADNCPHQPNPPINGVQPEICGQALNEKADRFVFLHSRIFPPFEGLDPGLKHTQKRERIHVLLHVIPNGNGVVLMPHQRTELQGLGVNLLGYLPHNSFYVSLPRNLATLQQIVALEYVRGISALRPKDKVAPQLRLQGPTMGRNDDGTLSLDVDFFADVPPAEIEAMLTQASLPFEHQYDHTYRITIDTWETFRRLVIQDSVYFVDDLPDEVYERTQNGQALINGQIVSNTMGYRGSGIVVSMTEIGLAEPTNRPDMAGRVTLGNNPILEPTMSDGEHPQMVSAIMIADETTFPTRAGLLPEANLISFSTAGLTLKAQHFGVNEDAHDDYGAILSNNSWGPANCNKIGEYRKRGKFFDRAVYDVGINIVYAAGNTRGPNGLFATEGCQVELYSLPHPVAKNDISVGNWDITTNNINSTSSAGPAADERLKPDLVAPGQGIDTIGWDEVNLVNEQIQGGGTSAASPVTSGVVGWLAESFQTQGMILDDIRPARYKAILVHTAKDVGPTGPDYMHGYGLIQADRAVRIAEEWSLWGREGTVDENTTQVVFAFDVTTAMSFYKATLVWDDEEGENNSTLALKNDLDLTLISPSGTVFYPYDLPLPVGAVTDDGSVPCLDPSCQDRLNNIEMVMVDPATDFIEQGTWEAVIDTYRLVSDEQSFSLVLTPPCPVELDESVTLTGDIDCVAHPLEPTGVLIQTDGVNMNCDNHRILGNDAGLLNFDGNYAGIRILADDAVVRNCLIRRFDVGIKVGDSAVISPTNADLRRNTLTNLGTVGIDLVGDNHSATENSFSEMIVSTGKGISVKGDNVLLDQNEFHLARNGGNQNNTVAILVRNESDNGTITNNTFDGLWWYGIRLRSLDPLKPVTGFLVNSNHFEGIEDIPIELHGAVNDTTVTANVIQAYGDGLPAINIIADEGVTPHNNLVGTNTIVGFTNQGQLGIQVIDAIDTHIQFNILSAVRVGISESKAKNTEINGNLINPVDPGDDYLSFVGISATESHTLTHIHNNVIRFSSRGIEVTTPVSASVVMRNIVDVTGIGVSVYGAWRPVLFENGINARQTGISVSSGPGAAISTNSIVMHATGAGIVVGQSDDAVVFNNTIISPTNGIRITDTQSISVTTNVINEPATTGIILNQDLQGWVDGNEINDSLLGIHYKDGDDATLINNLVNSLPGGVGIRLGTNAAGCPSNVNNILVQDNVLNGGALGVEVLCDVGVHTLINN